MKSWIREKSKISFSFLFFYIVISSCNNKHLIAYFPAIPWRKVLVFYKKRDRTDIIAEILYSCRSAQTQTYIRRQTSLSYGKLRSCLQQLLLNQWIEKVEDNNGNHKLVITAKGLVFLDKWQELQRLLETKNKHILRAPLPEII
ncbi:MAG: winged helix-turn-helix domain-containing protein [Candidatus Bathyarchaeota archaeon]|nr:winged helix-turn-helix domain-containing protein [Candidatus Bathyarchaeota archaeon]